MVGIIVNRYNRERHEVEIMEVESRKDGHRHFVNAREFRAGKGWLNTFTSDKHMQSLDMVNRQDVVPVESPR